MSKPLDETAIWAALEELSQRFLKAPLERFKALFVIGSLAGGYFQPGRSDVDLVALFAGQRPAPERVTELAELLERILMQYAPGFEVEILPRFESDLEEDPKSGLYQNPDLAARLLIQSRLLAGSYPLGQLRMPGPADFQASFPDHLSWWRIHHGAVETMSPLLQAKYLLMILRFWLAVLRGNLVYRKQALVERYKDAQPCASLSPSLESLVTSYLESKPIEAGHEKELLSFCGQLTEEIISFQL